MAKYTKRRHVRRTRKHVKRRGTRRHRGGGGTAKPTHNPKRGYIARSIVGNMFESAKKILRGNVSVLPTDAIEPYGNKVAPISPKKIK